MDATKRISKSLGGDRLGSGDKMNVSMHAYNRSTHDLSFAWRSSMNCGTLVPFISQVALPGDTWSINMETLVRTIPTIGPLYGSYKLQMDVFSCPIRLYNGLLHNNMLKIGLNMAQVKLPKITLKHRCLNPNKYENIDKKQIANDSLLAYLGLRGIGDVNFYNNTADKYVDIERKFNAVPILAYWDIFKNYYANKQEDYAYYIGADPQTQNGYFTFLTQTDRLGGLDPREGELKVEYLPPNAMPAPVTITGNTFQVSNLGNFQMYMGRIWVLEGIGAVNLQNLEFVVQDSMANYYAVPLSTLFPNAETEAEDNKWTLGPIAATYNDYTMVGIGYMSTAIYESAITLKAFKLDTLDDTRVAILQATGLNNELDIATLTAPPIKELTQQDGGGNNYNKYSQMGLAIKTHQSDLLNNWLETEWIDGTNGINQITAIDVSSGSFTIDALNLANKVYNMLNRVAVSGGSYEDYIEAVYSTEAMRRAESPIYMGGLSTEIVFEEVVSQSATEEQPLGSLAGRGTITNKRGGKVEIKVSEPSYIMGIVSITPRIDYSTGNQWDICELDTLDDLHKPALDGIGFEDLLQERGAWWGTWWDNRNQKWMKQKFGKTPAWINYMTNMNKTYGDFADENKCMYMTLNRRYERYKQTDRTATTEPMGIKDATTYVNPTKYNYTFADTELAAQNFWVQIGCGIESRRVMSAKVIPYL